MDRRRWIFVIFVVALAIASIDVYSNGFVILDEWGTGFSARVDTVVDGERRSSWSGGSRMYSSTHAADGVDTLVFEHGRGLVNVWGAPTDEITIRANVRSLLIDAEAALPAANDFRLEAVRENGALKVQLVPDPMSMPNVRDAFVEWAIVVPVDIALEVKSGTGFVNIANIGGPQHVEGTNTRVNMTPAQAAPVAVSLTGGQFVLTTHERVANYSVHASVNAGSITGDNVELQETDDGMNTVATATLGDGDFPLEIEMTDGDVRLRVLESPARILLEGAPEPVPARVGTGSD